MSTSDVILELAIEFRRNDDGTFSAWADTGTHHAEGAGETLAAAAASAVMAFDPDSE